MMTHQDTLGMLNFYPLKIMNIMIYCIANAILLYDIPYNEIMNSMNSNQ